MSDTKYDVEHIANSENGHGPLPKHLQTVTLTAEQFETLYLQPRDPRITGGLANRVGNPTPLGVSAFLLAHMPLAMDLLGFQGATVGSATAMLGSFYACAGVGMYFACIMEWIIGNTFPCVVFGTFAGFWTAYGIIVAPTQLVAASFAPAEDAGNSITATAAGAATPEYNYGLGWYFAVWGILVAVYFVASLRTNVPFAILFFSLIFVFELISAGYFHTGQGRTSLAAKEFKVAGGFALVVAITGFYIDIVLLLQAVNFPVNLPIFDLSTRFLVPKPKREVKDHEA